METNIDKRAVQPDALRYAIEWLAAQHALLDVQTALQVAPQPDAHTRYMVALQAVSKASRALLDACGMSVLAYDQAIEAAKHSPQWREVLRERVPNNPARLVDIGADWPAWAHEHVRAVREAQGRYSPYSPTGGGATLEGTEGLEAEEEDQQDGPQGAGSPVLVPAGVWVNIEELDGKASSVLYAFRYWPGELCVDVWMHSGNKYRYYGMTLQKWYEFINAPSKGRFYNGTVKKYYSGEKLEFDGPEDEHDAPGVAEGVVPERPDVPWHDAVHKGGEAV